MLISKKDIANVPPPLLMKYADGSWKLVTSVTVDNNCDVEILEKQNDGFNQRMITLEEAPFYVGEDVWELNYGATIMTLNHSSLDEHPANQLWDEWQKIKK